MTESPVIGLIAGGGQFPLLFAEAARKQGAKFILVERFQGKRIKNEEENYRLTLEEEIYDGAGNLLTFQSYSTTAENLTPIEAVGYLTMKADAERSIQLTGSK